jgi:proline iminopeptidase
MQHTDLAGYDLRKWRVVMFDQRGCGKSTPFGSLKKNTTWDVVADIEALRVALGLDKWFVSGGSWGATLALAYATKHPGCVTGLLLRGLSLCDARSQRWLYQTGGASEVFPEAWAAFLAVLPQRLRGAQVGWRAIAAHYQRGFAGPDAQKYADAWWAWENAVSFLKPRPDTSSAKERLALAALENHYFVNNCWFKEGQLLHECKVLKGVPITLVHGRYDMVCPVTGAYELASALPHAKLVIVEAAGHASIEPRIAAALRAATRSMHRQTRKVAAAAVAHKSKSKHTVNRRTRHDNKT